MNDFAKAIAGTLVGASIALFGTWYSTNRTAERDYRTELRQKIEALMAGAVRSNKCFDTLVLSGSEPKDCEEQEPLWKAITLTELYFPEMKPELTAFQEELLNAKVALLTCEPSRGLATHEAQDKRDVCAGKVYEKFNPSGKLEALFNKAKTLIPRLTE